MQELEEHLEDLPEDAYQRLLQDLTPPPRTPGEAAALLVQQHETPQAAITYLDAYA